MTSARQRLARRWPAWLPALIVTISVWPRIPITTLREDQGVVSMWGLQVLAGHLPYRDFVVYLSPLLAYLYGAAFWLFGPNLTVQRLLDAVPIVGGTALLGLLAQRFLPSLWAAAVALLWGVWLTALIGYGVYHFWGPALVIAMSLALAQRRPGVAGVAAAAALLAYQVVLPAVLAGLIVGYLLRRDLRDAAIFAAGPLATGLLLVLGLLASGTLGAFLVQTIGPFKSYQGYHRPPFPWNPLLLEDTLNWHSGIAAYWEFGMFWLLGVVIPLIIGAWLLVALFRRRGLVTPPMLLGTISTGLFLSAFLAHVGGPTCWFSAPLALLLTAMRLRSILGPSLARPAGRLALAPLVLLVAAGLTPAPVGYWLSCSTNPGGPLAQVSTLAGSVCLRRPEARLLLQVQRAVAEQPPESTAFLTTSPGLYLLTGTTPETPSYWVTRGYTSAQEVAWEERALSKTASLVVYLPDPDVDGGPTSAFDRYLADHYSEDPGYSGLSVLRRSPVGP